VLDPVDRVSEILFGLIMVIVATNTLSVINAGRTEVATMIIGALGCNLAWGVIDGGLYLIGCFDERARHLLTLRAVQQAGDAEAARQVILDALPSSLAKVVAPDELDAMRTRLLQLPAPPAHVHLTRDDILGGAAVCLLVFLSTLPVVVPFLVIGDPQLALRLSNGVAIAMLFACGYVHASSLGVRPWPLGLLMVLVGCLMVAVAMALGG
jgi:hypothetical protein